MRSALSSSEHSRVDLQQLESRICLASTISPISFSPPINSPVGSAAVIALGDFTGDGKTDVAVIHWVSNTVRVLLSGCY